MTPHSTSQLALRAGYHYLESVAAAGYRLGVGESDYTSVDMAKTVSG